MKQRYKRKRILKSIRHNRQFDWWFDEFIRVSVVRYKILDDAMEKAYAKSRQAQLDALA